MTINAYDYSTAGTSLVNAIVSNGEHITSNLDYYTLYTLNSLTATNYSAADAGQNLLRTCAIIGIQAQPVILSVSTHTAVDLTSSTNRTTYGMGTAIDGSSNSTMTSVTVYQLNFSLEHTGAWLTSSTDGSLSGSLAFALVNETALASLPFTTTSGGVTLNQFVFSAGTGGSSALASSSLSFRSTL